ncbi:MAG TPA: hypothetical protein VNU47_00430 [Candidatus Paceibacterota bacterium]|nr:hypothetical protein [Candidatus Paceibacterota bacterium]
MAKRERQIRIVEKVVGAMGSVPSLFVHSLIFLGFFAAAGFGILSLDSMLLILTTVVSLEAIYLSLFIQMTVNENTRSLREVEEDLEDIQEDVEELGEDLEDIQEDIEGISEDIDEIQEDVEEMQEEDKEEEERDLKQHDALDRLTGDVRRILEDLEALKKGK